MFYTKPISLEELIGKQEPTWKEMSPEPWYVALSKEKAIEQLIALLEEIDKSALCRVRPELHKKIREALGK